MKKQKLFQWLFVFIGFLSIAPNSSAEDNRGGNSPILLESNDPDSASAGTQSFKLILYRKGLNYYSNTDGSYDLGFSAGTVLTRTAYTISEELECSTSYGYATTAPTEASDHASIELTIKNCKKNIQQALNLIPINPPSEKPPQECLDELFCVKVIILTNNGLTPATKTYYGYTLFGSKIK